MVRKYGSELAWMRAVLKERYGDDRIGRSVYSRSLWILEGTGRRIDYVGGTLRHCGIAPDNLTARADFAAAAYWHERKLGPTPEEYVRQRHAKRPYV
jgi:hypothetical protein